jgi:hypothetical protein
MWDLLKQCTTNEGTFTRRKGYTLIEKIFDLSGSPNHPIQDIKILRKLQDNDIFRE